MSTKADIFDTPAEQLTGGSGNSEAYKASEGIHQATVVGVIDLGDHENKFQPGKTQRKGQILFALNDQTIVFSEEGKAPVDTGEPVSVISKTYTISFNEKATLPKDLASMGIKVDDKTTFGSIVGTKCQLVVTHSEEGYVNAVIAKPTKDQQDPKQPVYAPMFWFKNKEGQPTGYRMKLHPTLAIATERPKVEKKS